MVIYKAVKALNDAISKVLVGLTAMTMSAMSIIIFLQVIFRYVLKTPLSWSEESATYLFTIGTFLGAAMVLRTNKHINVGFFLAMIKNPKVHKTVVVAMDILMLLLCALVCWESAGIVAKLMNIGQTSPAMPWLKTCYVYICVPISMGIMALVKLESILKAFFEPQEQREGAK